MLLILQLCILLVITYNGLLLAAPV